MKDIFEGIYLYRGDCNKNKEMEIKLKLKHSCYCLYTKLIQGAMEICKPLAELINKHVDFKWDNSHCLSFTSVREKAVEYATYPDNLKEEELILTERLEDWEFIVATLSVSKLNPIESEVVRGVWEPWHLRISMGLFPG